MMAVLHVYPIIFCWGVEGGTVPPYKAKEGMHTHQILAV